jgi:peptidoglycan/LPS O-acetylase OafA/YrhL
MSPIALRGSLRSSRRRLAVVLVLLGLAGAVAVHHGMPMDMHAMPGHTVCLALLAGAALIVAGAARAAARVPRPRVAELQTPVRPLGAWCRSVPARAGPLYIRLVVLRL